MFLKKLTKLHHTLAFRLTLWYAAIFTASICVAFLLFYVLMTTVIQDETDKELVSQYQKYASVMAFKGINAVKNLAIMDAQAGGVKKIFCRLLSWNGEVFSSTNMSYWQDIEVDRKAVEALLQGTLHIFETITISKRRDKVRILYAIIGPGIILQFGQSMENHTRFIKSFQQIFLAVMAVMVLIATLIGWFMAKQALSGVEAVTRTADLITKGDLEKRVPAIRKGEEIDRLALTFNRMVDRIQGLLSEIKEMSDNIAHDLRSPITRIRGAAEVTLTTGKSMDEFEQMAGSTIEECDRLLDMINTMLVISKTEAGVGQLHREPMDIADIVRNACELFQPSAEDQLIALTCETAEPCRFIGDSRMIQRMIANLIDNAVKYSVENGTVEVRVTNDADFYIRICVTDTGIGIDPDDLPHIFERFYRCEKSRSYTCGTRQGTGLGLSLAMTIARAHGGDILVNSTPGAGSVFTVLLPRPSDRVLPALEAGT